MFHAKRKQFIMQHFSRHSFCTKTNVCVKPNQASMENYTFLKLTKLYRQRRLFVLIHSINWIFHFFPYGSTFFVFHNAFPIFSTGKKRNRIAVHLNFFPANWFRFHWNNEYFPFAINLLIESCYCTYAATKLSMNYWATITFSIENFTISLHMYGFFSIVKVMKIYNIFLAKNHLISFPT